MKKKQLHLAGFLWASQLTHSHAQWRHPRQDPNFLSPEYYQNLARIAERGKFDFVFFADLLAIPHRYGQSIDEVLRRGTQAAASLDPAFVVAVMAAATRHVGLGITRSSTYYPPYDIARTFASLDHLSRGRVAWNVVTSLSQAEAQNFGYDEHLDHDVRYERAEEFLEATFKLWDSWGEGALVQDKERGIFVDPSKVRAVSHEGKFFRTRGPLNVPRSPQGRPAIMQAGSSDRGKSFAARWAEIIFEIDPTPEGRQAYYRDVKDRAASFGRNPDDVKIFPSFIAFIGETESIAREKQAYHNELCDPVSGLITLSAHTDHDFSQYGLDEPVAELKVPGCQGLFDVARRLSVKQNLTLRDIGKLYAQGVLLPHLVGTPKQVADQIEASFAAEEADGFIFSAAYSPAGYEEFVDLVVPELQRRGVFRQEYTGTTLRDHLGLGKASLAPVRRLHAVG
ncbi:MAG: LLM class flavin-dependent oxidoreductase [Polyangiales bacterium]